MAMKNPWGDQTDSFENLTQKAASNVVKAVSDTVKAVATDAKQQITGDYSTLQENSPDGKTSSTKASAGLGKVQDDAQKKQQLLLQTRQNLGQINKQIQEIRQKKQKKEQENVRVEEQKKKTEKYEEKKKQDEPFWKKMLKGKTGSKEGNVRAGG